MYKMSDEEFFKVYGRMPRRNNNKNKKKKVKVYWSRIAVALIVVILLVVGIVKFASGKSKKGGAQNGKASVSSSAGKNDDYYAAPENKETDVVYDGIELTVCIDAAHGGVDKGAVGEDGRTEKGDTLKIAEALKQHLETCGVKVIMTRNDDSYVSVEDRCRIANEQGADVFVSIHRSSSDIPGSDPHGFEAWIHNSRPEADKAFAERIMSKLNDIGISENRGVRTGYPDDRNVNYPINELTKMPSVLLDMGYLTSSIDNPLLDANLEAYARAIGNAIITTARDLGVTDDNGARLRDGQLLSDKTAPVEKTKKPESSESKSDESSQDEESSETEYPDVTEYDNSDEDTGSEVGSDETIYTDDGMVYHYTDPMVTE